MGCRFESCLWSQPIKSLEDNDSSTVQSAKNAKVCSETCSNRPVRPQPSRNSATTRFHLAHCSLSKNLGDT